VHLLIKEHATKDDLLMGLIHAYTVRSVLKLEGYKVASNLNFLKKIGDNEKQSPQLFDILRESREMLHKNDSIIDKDTFEDHKKPHIDVDKYIIDNDRMPTIGDRTVREIMNSPWLVEELLLETRHARLEIL
jgi:hypothetical protein